MRDILFSMPLGPMPGPRADIPVPSAPIHPMNLWKSVEDNSQVEVNGLGQMRTRIAAWIVPDESDFAMINRDAPKAAPVELPGAALVGFVRGERDRIVENPLVAGNDWMIIKNMSNVTLTTADGAPLKSSSDPVSSNSNSKQSVAPRPQGIGSVHGCQCDSCNMFRLLGQ